MSEKLKELVVIVSDEGGKACRAIRSELPDAQEGVVYGIYTEGGPRSTLGSHVRLRPDGELEWARWNLAKRRYVNGGQIDLDVLRASGAARIDVAPPRKWIPALENFRRAFSELPKNEEGYGVILEAACRTGAPLDWCPGILRRVQPELTREQAYYNVGVMRVQRSVSDSNRLWETAKNLLRSAGVELDAISWELQVDR